jgi:hypothetical protein
MEKILGVESSLSRQPHQEGSRWDAIEADSLEQDENRDAQRQRYQRHYWESVPEDGRVGFHPSALSASYKTLSQEPIVPAVLEHAKDTAQRLVKLEEHLKSSHPRLMPRFPDNKYIRSPPSKQVLQKDGRPTLTIKDVGGKFIDLGDSLKRISVKERRAREKGKKLKVASPIVGS